MQDAPENLTGAVIFFAYIAAALLFTGITVNDLAALSLQEYRESRKDDRSSSTTDRKRPKAYIFSALSVISFSMLSYHMLGFLISSYSTWATARNIPLPVGYLGQKGLVSALTGRSDLPIWTWSKQSTLFQTFAEDILKPSNFWWTLQALTFSLGWNTYMAVQGARHEIPHLWAYFVLDQILPVSFTLNLFCLAMALTPTDKFHPILWTARRAAQIAVPVLYFACLSIAPGSVGTGAFIPVLLLTRLLLFAPFACLRPTENKTWLISCGRTNTFAEVYTPVAYCFLVCSGLIFVRFSSVLPRTSVSDMIAALHDSPAVSALGYDYMLGLVSVCVWWLLGKGRESRSEEAEGARRRQSQRPEPVPDPVFAWSTDSYRSESEPELDEGRSDSSMELFP